MEFLEVAGLRRSIRFYKSTPVELDKIQRILEVARYTTCSGNLQPWRALVVEKDKLTPKDREALLAADNYQGAHVQAPVWIYWFADFGAGNADGFRKGVHHLVEIGALPTCYGWTHEAIDATIAEGKAPPVGMPPFHELLHNRSREDTKAYAKMESVGACAVACLAAVNEGLGTCLHMAAALDKYAVLREVLGVPETWEPVWLQLVGYPAEEPEAGGQRPRLPFEQLFHYGTYGKPFVRDPKVVEDLKAKGLLREQMPKPGRFEEIKRLAQELGLPL